MNLDRQPRCTGRFEKPRGLRRRESYRFAKCVGCVCEGFGHYARKEVAAQHLDVTVLVVVFGRQRVSPQESRDDIDFAPITEQSRSSKLVQFRIEIQTVSGLYLDGRDTVGE